MTTHAPNKITTLMSEIAARARAAGVFGSVEVKDDRIDCAARASASPAWYRIDHDGRRLWASLVTPDRWLSHSIEADLLHTGDKIDELLEEELVDLGYSGARHASEHFRSEDKLFTFRTPMDVPPGGESASQTVENAARLLLAYEACFRNLGDMDASDEG